MENYIVVLFKNRTRKKILNKFKTFKKAKLYFESILNKNEEVIFDVVFETGKPVDYEIALLEKNSSHLLPVYLTDEMGRNVKVKLNEEGMTIFQISKFKKEESIYDLSKNKKVKVEKFIKDYLTGDGLKMISSLNNKIIVQNEEKINLFSLKNESESSRFLDCLTYHFQKIKKKDCLLVKDNSTAQKKYLYELLEKSGVDKKILYRKFTTYPLSK